MPLYEYRCTQCGHRFEKIQPFSAEPEKECPRCQGALVRPLTAPALQFKGAGWYVNDYAAKSVPASESGPEAKPGAAEAGKSAPAGESKSSESKAAESKPAAAPASAPASSSAKPGGAS